jgi:gas vesicle protein
MHDRTPYSKWMLSLLAGALAGDSLALFMAPQSGGAARVMMRRTLRARADSARDLKDRLVPPR